MKKPQHKWWAAERLLALHKQKLVGQKQQHGQQRTRLSVSAIESPFAATLIRAPSCCHLIMHPA
jgi:hypothetical protein